MGSECAQQQQRQRQQTTTPGQSVTTTTETTTKPEHLRSRRSRATSALCQRTRAPDHDSKLWGVKHAGRVYAICYMYTGSDTHANAATKRYSQTKIKPQKLQHHRQGLFPTQHWLMVTLSCVTPGSTDTNTHELSHTADPTQHPAQGTQSAHRLCQLHAHCFVEGPPFTGCPVLSTTPT